MKLLSRLLLLLAPHYKMMLLAALLGFGAVGSNVALLATSAYLISMAALHPELYVLSVAIVGVRFFGISRALCRYAERYVSHNVTFRLLTFIRVWIYAALEPLAPARLFQFQSGELLSRIVADVETLKFFYLKVVAPPLIALFMAIVLGLWLSSFNWLLAAISITGFVLVGMAIPALLLLLGSQPARQVVAARAKLQAFLVDSIQGLSELTAFDQTSNQLAATEQLAQDYQAAQAGAAKLNALTEALGFLLSQLTMVAALLVAVFLVVNEQLAGVQLAVVALAVQSSFEAVLPLPQCVYYWQESRAAVERLFALTDAHPEVPNGGCSVVMATTYGLTVKNLSFSYHQAPRPALRSINFSVQAGGKIAIIGPSGAGKTTIVDLLLRFFDYQEGEIYLCGREVKNLKDFEPELLRQCFGVITQQTHVFNHSIRNNILLARPTATPEELSAVIKAVKLDTLIASLPEGLDSPVGQNGQVLSGGERQRVAIARVLLKNASVILCDESTTGLDSITEQGILAEMAVLFKEKTVITITHRLINLAAMDCIYVLDQGQIVEAGTQQELLDRRNLYYRLYYLQQDNISDRNFSGNV
jgi:ATP-binding cassette subfamily C protein CydC